MDDQLMAVRDMIGDANPAPSGTFAGAVDGPEARTAFERIVAITPPRRRRRGVRRGLAALAAGALVAGSVWTTAEASGAVPAGLLHYFHAMEKGFGGRPSDPAGAVRGGRPRHLSPLRIDTKDARRVGAVHTPDGSTVEYWVAPANERGGCEWVRLLPRGGGERSMGGACIQEGPPEQYPSKKIKKEITNEIRQEISFDYRQIEGTQTWIITGQVGERPTAARVRIRFEGGRGAAEATVTQVGTHGYFLAVVPFATAKDPNWYSTRAIVYDGYGKVIGRG